MTFDLSDFMVLAETAMFVGATGAFWRVVR